MNNFKSRAAFLLALITVASTFASCGGEGTADETTVGDDVTTAPSDKSDPRLSIDDELPAIDLEGYEFRIMPAYFGNAPTVALYAPEEASGDVVDDAIYDRNMRIEERFKCKIVERDAAFTDYNEHGSYIKNFILADDDEYDLTMNHVIGGANISLDGIFMNLYDMKYINFDKPWWSPQMVDEMTILGQTYVTGDTIGLNTLKSTKVLYINKGKFDERKTELPYQTVLDGNWTFDALNSLTKDVWEDLNGDSKRDVDDFFGYVGQTAQNGWLVSMNCPVLAKDDDATLKIVANTERVATLVEKVYKFYYENQGTLALRGNDPVTGVSQNAWQANLFANGHGLTAFSHLSSASTTMRTSNVEYGIIPFPKFDENQEDYRTFAGGNLIGVPITVSDPDTVSLILEALVAETYKTVYPAYFDIALKEKFTYDSESGQMLDIIANSMTVSFAYIYDNWKGFGHMLGSILDPSNPSSDFSSYYAQRISSAETRLKLITDFFEDNQ